MGNRIGQRALLVWALVLIASCAWAQDKGTFMVQDGAFPWHDRVNNWALSGVPDSLKGSGPLPQQSCTARTIEVPGQPRSITIGVSEKDLEKFNAKFPAAKETGERIAVRNPAGNELPYLILIWPDPPAKIDGAGLGAGLLLLKIGDASPSTAPATAATNASPPAAPDKDTFMVQDGAFPWQDRMNGAQTWMLDSVPEGLKGSGPLPRQNCSSRVLSVPGKLRSVTIGVAQPDLEKFKTKYPDATETGEDIAVKNPQGTRIAYRVFTFPSPPANIGAGVGFGAGLLLLKIEGDATGNAAASSSAKTGSSPATVPATPIATGTIAPATPTIGAPASPLAPATNPAPAAVTLPAKENFHIYLLMGQSNMVGRDTDPIASQNTNPHILALDGKGQWVVAKEPMHAGGTGVGPGIPFAVAMLKDNPDISIGLVPCAVGGTPLSRWVKGGDLYEKAVSRAKAAAPAGVLKGVLWHQGESDTGKKEEADSYEARLTQMFKDLRQDLEMPNLPIVVGQLGDFLTPARYPYVDTVRGAIEHVAVVVPGVGFADAAGLLDKGDKLHFSAEAQQEFGGRYAIAMQQLQKPRGAK